MRHKEKRFQRQVFLIYGKKKNRVTHTLIQIESSLKMRNSQKWKHYFVYIPDNLAASNYRP